MKYVNLAIISLLCVLLLACGRSPDSQFYLLNPLPPGMNTTKKYSHLLIRIAKIETPAYTTRPQVIIHSVDHQVKVEEYQRWAEGLDKNIKRVILANLKTLLPGAAIENELFDTHFKSNYQLVVTLSQIEINQNGQSLLRGDYIIYSHDYLIKKGSFFYQQKVPQVNLPTLVASMNRNLNYFTQDIAKAFMHLPMKID